MTVLLLILALVFVKYGGALAVRDWTGEKVTGWVFLLAGLALAAAVGSRASASPPIVYSPYVIQPTWVATGSISDQWGYVRTTKDCAAVNDYPSRRTVPAATVLKMIVNPHSRPHADPSAWGYSADNQYVEAVLPIGGDPSSGMYLPMACLEGVKPA